MLKIDNKIYLSWSDVEDLVEVLCEKITKIPNITHISGLSRGGLIPAVLVSHKLNLPYTDKILWSDDKIIRNTLLIDDICDSGETLFNHEAAITAVLHFKPHTSKFTPTAYAQKQMGDEWVIYPWERKDSKAIQDYKLP
mgnify:FL=1|jgi:hypoxanthine phosphoribosyltransferase|tara:strand:+ start:48 stop:464 length:417 start_codon:yes stop_codon:yes gene_type:complete